MPSQAYRFESGRRYSLFFRETDDPIPIFRRIFFELFGVAMEVRGDFVGWILGEIGFQSIKRGDEIAFFEKRKPDFSKFA